MLGSKKSALYIDPTSGLGLRYVRYVDRDGLGGILWLVVHQPAPAMLLSPRSGLVIYLI